MGVSFGIVCLLSCLLTSLTCLFVYKFAGFRLERHRRRLARSHKQEADTFGATPPQLSEAVRRTPGVWLARSALFLSRLRAALASCLRFGVQFGRRPSAEGGECLAEEREGSLPSPSASVVALRIAAANEESPPPHKASVSASLAGGPADAPREQVHSHQPWPRVDRELSSAFSLPRSSVGSSSSLSSAQPKTFSKRLRRCWLRMPWYKDLHAEVRDTPPPPTPRRRSSVGMRRRERHNFGRNAFLRGPTKTQWLPNSSREARSSMWRRRFSFLVVR